MQRLSTAPIRDPRFRARIVALSLLASMAQASNSQERPPVKYDAKVIAEMSDRMNRMKAGGYDVGFGFGQELAALPSPVGYQILRDNWNKGASLFQREQMFKGFVFSAHPDALLVINLGMRDPHLSMQAWSMSYLSQYAYVDFSRNFDAYRSWFEKYKMFDLAGAAPHSLADRLSAVSEAGDTTLTSAVSEFFDGIPGGPIQQLSGTPLEPAIRAMAKPDELYRRLEPKISGDPLCARMAVYLVAAGTFPAKIASARCVALLKQPEVLASHDLIGVVNSLHFPEVNDYLLEKLSGADKLNPGALDAMVSAVLDSEDPKVIPALIALLPKAEPSAARVISRGLERSLGIQVPSNAGPDFWKSWQEKNKSRFTQSGSMDGTPTFTVEKLSHLDYIPDADDVKDIPSKSFLLGGDENKRYLISGPMNDGSPKKLCIVMPGGEGSIEFHPFVKRILKFGLGEGWIVAQPIAPVWSHDSNRVVWPSVAVADPAAKFTTETFIDEMLDEVAAKYNVSEIYMLGWSSSGPAIYSYAGHGKHPIAGAFVAMSIFNDAFFAGGASLSVKRFYILHSPQDFIKMSNPEAAQAALTKLGIPVKLDTYQGGHGWHGPVYAEIKDGMKFLTAKG